MAFITSYDFLTQPCSLLDKFPELPVLPNTPYTCCGKTFKTEGGYRSHDKRVHQLKAHECIHCPLKFAFKSELERHYGIISRTRTCDLCHIIFTRHIDLTNHVKSTHPEKCIACPFHPDQLFTTRRGFGLHAKTHDMSPTELLKLSDKPDFSFSDLRKRTLESILDENSYSDAVPLKNEEVIDEDDAPKVKRLTVTPPPLELLFAVYPNNQNITTTSSKQDFSPSGSLERLVDEEIDLSSIVSLEEVDF